MYNVIEDGSVIESTLDNYANLIGSTLGPRGKCVIVENRYGTPHITKDGYNISKGLFLKDKAANNVLQLIKASAAKSVEEAGDGTTTTCVLTAGFYKEAKHEISKSNSVNSVIDDIDKDIALTKRVLTENSIPCESVEDIYNIANISSNGDKAVAQLIADAYDKVGDGSILLAPSNTFETFLEESKGFSIDRGYLSPFFANNESKHCQFFKPLILLINDEFNTTSHLLKCLEFAAAQKSPLLIVCNDVSQDVLGAMVTNTIRGTLKVCIIKSPKFGELQEKYLEDLSIFTNATVVTLDGDTEFVPENILGMCEHVDISKDRTVISNESEFLNVEGISARIAELQTELSSASPAEKESLNERISNLKGIVVTIKVGGNNEFEIKEKYDRIEDALCATRIAVKGGMSIGGGKAFVNAINLCNYSSAATNNVLLYPLRKLCENSELDFTKVLSDLNAGNDNYGLNFSNNSYANLLEDNVLDPTLVLINALDNAWGIAKLLLKTSYIVSEIDPALSE